MDINCKVLKLTVFLFLLTSFKFVVKANEDLIVAPLWNETRLQNDSEHCSLRAETNGGFLFTGMAGGQTCSIHLTTVESGAMIEIVNLTSDIFLYFEKQDVLADCESKYAVVTGYEHGESCSAVVWNGLLQIVMQGEATIKVSAVSTNQSPLISCQSMSDGESAQLISGTNTDRCTLVEYNHTITCSLINSKACSFHPFPFDCTNTFGNQVVYSNCPEKNIHASKSSLIIYRNTDIKVLDLSLQNIDTITDHAFVAVNHLVELYATSNRLTKLTGGTFKSLKFLTFLRLWKNQIRILDPDVFDDLISLSTIGLAWNELSHLPKDLFKHTVNLNRFEIEFNYLTSFDKNLLSETKNLVDIFLAFNKIESLDDTFLKHTTKLEIFSVLDNKLCTISNDLIANLTDLRALSLGTNHITSIRYDLLWHLRDLTFLRLGYNRLTTIHYRTFEALSKLEFLFLDFNRITVFHSETFKNTVNLLLLELSGNQLTRVPNIPNLHRLGMLSIREIRHISITKNTFKDISAQCEIFVSQTEVCECYVPKSANCTAVDVRSPYLTCDRLLSNRALMVMMWIIGLNALGGNLFALIRGLLQKGEAGKMQMLLISNLAMSDLLMGIFMLIIACADIYFGDSFPLRSESWRSGITCRIAGAMSILSSEASVFFVTLITLDRFVNIRSPHIRRNVGRKSSAMIIAMVWMIALIIAIIPSIFTGNYTFYDISNVCIALPLAQLELFSKDVSEKWIWLAKFRYIQEFVTSKSRGRVPGLYYASAIFLGLNGMCYLVILLCYIDIVRSVYKSSKSVGLKKDDRSHVKLNVKVTAIVMTDFLCWAPVVVLGILVQVGLLTLPPSVFAWMVTVVIPINSAINPYLYTIVDLIMNRRRNQAKRKRGMTARITETSQTTAKSQM